MSYTVTVHSILPRRLTMLRDATRRGDRSCKRARIAESGRLVEVDSEDRELIHTFNLQCNEDVNLVVQDWQDCIAEARAKHRKLPDHLKLKRMKTGGRLAKPKPPPPVAPPTLAHRLRCHEALPPRALTQNARACVLGRDDAPRAFDKINKMLSSWSDARDEAWDGLPHHLTKIDAMDG